MIIVIILIIFSFSSSSSSSSNDIFLKAYLMYCKSVPAVSVIPVVLGSKYNGDRTYSPSDLLQGVYKRSKYNGDDGYSGDRLTVHQICFQEHIITTTTTTTTTKTKNDTLLLFFKWPFPGLYQKEPSIRRGIIWACFNVPLSQRTY